MEAIELTTDEIFFLNMCKDNPEFKYTGILRTSINTICSYKLVEYAGNLQYHITKEGENVLKQLKGHPDESVEYTSHPLVGESVKAATFTGV